jgi:hypothetical protein
MMISSPFAARSTSDESCVLASYRLSTRRRYHRHRVLVKLVRTALTAALVRAALRFDGSTRLHSG